MSGGEGFDDLDAEEKVKYCQAELAATLAKLDDAIARMTQLRTEIEDPGGLVRITLGHDGRLLSLFIEENIGQRLTNLQLEELLNRLFDSGNAAMRLSRSEFWETIGDFPPPRL